MDALEKQYVELGRKLITLCEANEIFSADEEYTLKLWNAAVTCGNKLVSFNTPWSNFKDLDDLTNIEREALIMYLEGRA